MNKEEKILDIRAEILNSYTSGTKWVTEIDALLSSYRDAVEEVSKLSQHDVIKNEVAVCCKGYIGKGYIQLCEKCQEKFTNAC